jgi:6-phosphofructokinase 1
MGRKAGHLALGIGKAAGATLTVIPEEFSRDRISLDDVAAVIDAAIIKRRSLGRTYGLAIVAEGIGEKLDPAELAGIAGVQIAYDPYGHIALADIPLAALIKQRVQKRFFERGDRVQITDVSLGYELRCAPPIPFDIDYTRTLGYGAARFLLAPPADPQLRLGGFICLDAGHLKVLPFDDLRDPATGRTRVRLVDVESEHYRVSRDYMIRLTRADLEDRRSLERLAAAAKMTPEAFRAEFSKVVTLEEAQYAATA